MFFGIMISFNTFCQTTRTSTTGGSLWFDGGTGWSAGVPISTSAVTFNNSATATILDTQSATITSFTAGNNSILTINSGGTLTVNGNFTTNNGTTINVYGNLVINGDLVVNNNLIWNVTGTVTITGNVNLGTNGNLTVSNTGTMNISGNVTATNNTNLVVDGAVTIGGNISVGNGSTISGTGTVAVSGTCTDGGSTFCATGPQPISLLFFKGSLEPNKISLSWSTASELNFDYFDLEKSSDGKNFNSISTIKGNGTTNENHDYSFNDEKPLIGKNYYRLKSVDFDGYTETFNVVMVDFDGSKSFSVWPNPSDGVSFTAETNFTPISRAYVAVYNTMGSEIAHFEVSGNSSTLNIPVKLESGVYYAKYISSDFTSTSRVLVK